MSQLLNFLALSIIICGIAMPVSAQESLNGTVNFTIKVTGFKQAKGKVKIAVYNNSTEFLLPEKEYKSIYLDVNKSILQHTVKLPKGNYAIALYHDDNSNGICDRNFLGVPTERYGFSNNIRPILSAPSYQSTKVELKDDIAIEIALLK